MLAFDNFDFDTLQSCLKYVVDSVAWLMEADHLSKVSNGFERELIAGITSKLDRATRDARELHNRCVTVNRIPAKLLASIFTEVQDTVRPAGAASAFDGGWMSINRVCRHWRQIATVTPNLWTRLRIPVASAIGDEGYRSLSTSFLRSGALPLTLWFQSCSSNLDQGFFTGLLANIPRVQDLRLHNVEMTFLSCVNCSAPVLETLEMVSQGHLLAGDFLLSVLKYGPFNGWQTPRLRTVKMVRCGTAWRFMPMRHLRYLSISHIHLDSDTATALFNVIALNASLEDLILTELSAWPRHWAELELLGRARPRINMSKLRRLYIGTPFPTLIEMIAFPLVLSTTDGCATCYDTRFDKSFHAPETEFLFPCALFNPCRKLHVTEDGLVGVNNGSAFWSATSNVTDPLCIRIMESPNLALQIEELWLLCYYEPLVEPLQCMSRIKKLVILDGHGGTVLPWLRILLSTDDGLPELKELWVELDIEEENQVEAFNLVLQFLRRHNDAGRRVHTFRVFQMTLGGPDWLSYNYHWYRLLLALVADEVTFETLEEYPPLGLPRVCREPSPAHTDWPVWP